MFSILGDLRGFGARLDLTGRYEAPRIVLGGVLEVTLAEAALPDLVSGIPDLICFAVSLGEYRGQIENFFVTIVVHSSDVVEVTAGDISVRLSYDLKSDCTMVLTDNDSWEALYEIRKFLRRVSGYEVGARLRYDPKDTMIVMGDWLPVEKVKYL